MKGQFSSKGPTQGGGREALRRQDGRAMEWRFPDEPHRQGMAPATGAQLCQGCHAVYADKHWHWNEDEFAAKSQLPGAVMTVCPGCRAVSDRQFQGELTLRASPPKAGIDERRQRLIDVEARARRLNPVARIAEMTIEAGRWHLHTTTAALAVRLGKEMQKAFGGELTVDKLPRSPYVRVTWVEACGHDH